MPSPAQSLAKLNVEELLQPVLVQLVVIVAAARIAGVLARRLGQPAVVGEVVAGLLLGPSLLGWLLPELSAAIFKPHLDAVPQDLADAAFPKIFQVFSQVGLIFLLFLIGLEFEFGHLKERGKAALAVSLAGIALPFALGAGLARLVHPHLEDHPTAGPVPLFGLTLFMGISMAITAIPVLGRIMLELNVQRTRLGTVTMTAAAINDAVGWVMLAAVAALAKATFDPADTALMVAETVGFALVVALAVRPLAVRYFASSLRANAGNLSFNALAVLVVLMLLCAVATNLIGIFAIFGPFLLGVAISDQPAFRAAVTARLRDLVTVFFLPVFFTYTGLRTEVTSVTGAAGWLTLGGVLLAAVAGKLGGCAVAARVTGMPWRESLIVGAMMNTRGLVELIVINVGYELGVIPKSLFAALIIMAVITTAMTTPLLLLLRRGTEIEAPIAASGFLTR